MKETASRDRARYPCPEQLAHRRDASGPGQRGDLEVVQEELSHSSIETTTICSYAKVTKEDKARAADALAKAYRSSQHNRASGASQARRVPTNSGLKEQGVAKSRTDLALGARLDNSYSLIRLCGRRPGYL